MTAALVAFVRARLDEEAAAAEAARRQVAARACPPPQVDEWAARAGHWKVVPWLFSGRAEADLERWGRVEIATLAKEHIVRHDPARVLEEVEAKRQTLQELEQAEVTLSVARPGTPPHDLMTGAVNTLRRVVCRDAAVHGDHPDYREEWRP